MHCLAQTPTPLRTFPQSSFLSMWLKSLRTALSQTSRMCSDTVSSSERTPLKPTPGLQNLQNQTQYGQSFPTSFLLNMFHFWLRQELKKCKCPSVCLSDESLSRVYNLHLFGQSWVSWRSLFKTEPKILRLVVIFMQLYLILPQMSKSSKQNQRKPKLAEESLKVIRNWLVLANFNIWIFMCTCE